MAHHLIQESTLLAHAVRYALAVIFIGAGALKLLRPAPVEGLVPLEVLASLGLSDSLGVIILALSGLEILLGISLLLPRPRLRWPVRLSVIAAASFLLLHAWKWVVGDGAVGCKCLGTKLHMTNVGALGLSAVMLLMGLHLLAKEQQSSQADGGTRDGE